MKVSQEKITLTKPPTEEELAERDQLWRAHSELTTKKDPDALHMQSILERCYPPDPKVRGYRWDEMYQKWRDLFGALLLDIGPVTEGFKSLVLANIAFKKWNVEEAFYCEALEDIFTIKYVDEYK